MTKAETQAQINNLPDFPKLSLKGSMTTRENFAREEIEVNHKLHSLLAKFDNYRNHKDTLFRRWTESYYQKITIISPELKKILYEYYMQTEGKKKKEEKKKVVRKSKEYNLMKYLYG